MAYGKDKNGGGEWEEWKHPTNQEMGFLEETVVCYDRTSAPELQKQIKRGQGCHQGLRPLKTMCIRLPS